ncbi:MAG: PKD domain-containing protein [Candidatus Aminicenantes bacterium]|nr:MAG: PKD domain-containing protein [Candidatus Aminicenantes bacterium]
MTKKIFILAVLTLFSVMMLGGRSDLSYQEFFEDFSVDNGEWTKYDPEELNKIELDYTYDQRLEFNHWIRYQPGYVSREYPVQDFVLEYDINIIHHGGNGNVVGIGFSDTPGTLNETQNGIFGAFYAGWPGGGGVPHLDLRIYENGTNILNWRLFLDFLISRGRPYYVRIEKFGDQVTISIFSDAARTNHISGSPKTFTTNLVNTTFNYFYAVNGYLTSPQGNWEWTTGWIDNIYVKSWVNQSPEVDAGLTQTVEQETHQGTEVTQIGHAYDADGDALTYQWKEGETVLDSGTIPAPNTPPTDADVSLTHMFTPGVHTVTLFVSDGELSSSDDVLIIVEDTLQPVSTLTTNPATPDGLDGWFKSAVQVTITAEDSGSGIKEIYYKKDSDSVFTIVQGDQAVFSPGDGTYTIEYYALDKAGHEESPHNFYSFKVDTVNPETTAAIHGNGSGNIYINHATIILEASDTMSGVKEIHYIINGSETVVFNSKATINLNQVGTYTIEYWAMDNAGNQETHHSLQIEIISPQGGVVLIKNIIANLPNTTFAKNAQNRRNALLNKLDQVIAAIDSGQYLDAINKLLNDIYKKMDGCFTSGAADKNDWLIDCQAQSQLNNWINILITGLTEIMNG